DDDGIAAHSVEPANDRAAESVLAGILHRANVAAPRGDGLEDVPRFVRAAVVHDDYLVRHVMQRQLEVQVLHGRGDAAGFVARRDHERQQLKRFVGGGRGHQAAPDTCSHSGCASACAAISSRIAGSPKHGRHCQVRDASAESSTIHGTSNRRGRGSLATACAPNRWSHHSVSCRSDMLFSTPPDTLTTFGRAPGAPAYSCFRKIAPRSAGCKQSRTCKPLPWKPIYESGRRRRCALIQNEKMPCVACPNCPAPARTPHLLIQTGRSNVWPYSSAIASDASLLTPCKDSGGLVENSSEIPAALTPWIEVERSR